MWKKTIKEGIEKGKLVSLPTKEQVFQCQRGSITGILAENEELRERLAAQLQQFVMDREENTEFLFVPARGLYRGSYKTFLRYARAMAAVEPGMDLEYFQLKMGQWNASGVGMLSAQETSRLFVISLALSRQSQVLIFDGIMNNISDKRKTDIEAAIIQWRQKDNGTVILLSHRREELETIADHIWFWEEEACNEAVVSYAPFA